MKITRALFAAAALLFIAAPSVSHASALSSVSDWFSGVSAASQTADAIAANSPWLDVQANGSDGPLSVYDGMEVELQWAVTDVFNIYTCSIAYPAQSGRVTESVTAFGTKTVTLYPSASPVTYIDFVCTGNGHMGHDVVLVTKVERPTTPPPSTRTGSSGYSSSGGGHPTVGGSTIIQVNVPVTSGNTFQYSGGSGGSGGTVNFGGIVQGVVNAPGTITNAVSGMFNNPTRGTTAWSNFTHGLTVANNSVQQYAVQPTQNWINNNIINPIRNFLGLGGQSSGSGSSAGGSSNGQQSGSAGDAHSHAATGSGGAGGTYQVHVGPLSSGASGPADGSNNCNGGTDNCNNNNDPYGFEQDPSKVQNTNDIR